MTLKKTLIPLLFLPLFLLPAACTEDESDLGLNLQDPATLYHGITGNVIPQASTLFDDDLSTAGYTAGIFGFYTDDVFGHITATIYSQISIASSTGISLSDEVVIDSAVMTLILDTAFPVKPDSTLTTLHVNIMQLAEPLVSDSAYTSTSSLPDNGVTFFDDDVDYAWNADSLRLPLHSTVYPVLKQTCSREDFIANAKGFLLRLTGSNEALLTVNFSATNTRITLYYHTATDSNLRYNFIINSSGAAHFMNYSHDYTGKVIAPIANHTADSLSGADRLYLEPLGGTKVRLNLQPFLDTFKVQHPYAVIHYAELLLPVTDSLEQQRPNRILALCNAADGTSAYVTDANVLTNPATVKGFDGYYHSDSHYYRLRITQHLQELLRSGRDYGTDLIIDGRRSTAFRTVLNGTATDSPIRIQYIYTE